jgi:anti-anti-sigma factor
MPQPEPTFGDLEVIVREHAQMTVVALAGELDAYTVPSFRDRLEQHRTEHAQLVIDLSRVTLLDSAGLAALLSLRNRAAAAGERLARAAPRGDGAALRLRPGAGPARGVRGTWAGARECDVIELACAFARCKTICAVVPQRRPSALGGDTCIRWKRDGAIP